MQKYEIRVFKAMLSLAFAGLLLPLQLAAQASAQTVPLELYWSAARGDNFSTTTAEGKAAAKASGYTYVRKQGYIFSQRRAGTVALTLFWNSARKDNFSSATVGGVNAAKQAGYSRVRIQGYVYSAKQPGTIPLKLFWSAARQDNFSSSTQQGERAALAAGYKFVRIQGWILRSDGTTKRVNRPATVDHRIKDVRDHRQSKKPIANKAPVLRDYRVLNKQAAVISPTAKVTDLAILGTPITLEPIATDIDIPFESYGDLQQKAMDIANSGQIEFSSASLSINGDELFYDLGRWEVKGRSMGDEGQGPLELLLGNQSWLEDLRRWHWSDPSQENYTVAWNAAIANAEIQVSGDFEAYRSGRLPAGKPLGTRVRSAIVSSLQQYATSRNLKMIEQTYLKSEFLSKMILRVKNDPPDARIFFMLKWDFDIMQMRGLDPMQRMVEAQRSEFTRGLGTYVYRILQGSNYSPASIKDFHEGLNELSIPAEVE